jgi:hypothetical protein
VRTALRVLHDGRDNDLWERKCTVPISSRHPEARELARRLSGTDEVRLVWHPASDCVELSVCDLETGAGFRIAIAPQSAVDAFYHPYAYAPKRAEVDCGAGATIADG